MSLRLQMLQVARLSRQVLGDDASSLVERYVHSQQNSDGGFRDRAGVSDLYYTSFAIDVLTALQTGLPEATLTEFLTVQYEQLDDLDFVHLCCLARAFSALEKKPPSEVIAAIQGKVESYRSADGGYNTERNSAGGSAYACFLALGVYADHGQSLPDPVGVVRCLRSLRVRDEAWANDAMLPVPNIPATAAAVTLSRHLGLPIPSGVGEWILSSLHPSGGFSPFPGAPIPDLLSTAVALHALDGLRTDYSRHKESLLDFIDTLWTAEGGFYGTWDDDVFDLEYTYYGLLALGHLSL